MSEDMKKEAMTSLQKQGADITKQTTLQRVKGLLSNDQVKEKFNEVLKDKAPGFIASITSLVSSSKNFEGVDANSIMQSCMIAATLDLPINQNLGFAYIIPYNSREGKKASFQAGYKAFIQLALRTGQYQTMNATEIYEGELTARNRITGEIVLDEAKKTSDKIVGYVGYFKLTNGFEKSLFMTVDELLAHGKKYSKSFNNPDSLWKTNPHAMMLKTVLKMLLSKYGMLSVQMQTAIQADQAVIKEKDGEIEYEYVDRVEDAEVVEEKPELNKEAQDLFNPENELTVEYWTAKILECPNEDWAKFKKSHKSDLEMFTGEDEEKLKKVISEKDRVAKK